MLRVTLGADNPFSLTGADFSILQLTLSCTNWLVNKSHIISPVWQNVVVLHPSMEISSRAISPMYSVPRSPSSLNLKNVVN